MKFKRFFSLFLVFLLLSFALTFCSNKKSEKTVFKTEYKKIIDDFYSKAKKIKTQSEAENLIKEKNNKLEKLLKSMEGKKLNEADQMVKADIQFELQKNEEAKKIYSYLYENSKNKSIKKEALTGLIKTSFVDKDKERIVNYLKIAKENYKSLKEFAPYFLIAGVVLQNPEYVKIGLNYKIKYPYTMYVPAGIEYLKIVGEIKSPDDPTVLKVKKLYKDDKKLISAIDKKLGLQPLEGKKPYDIKDLTPINVKKPLTLSSLKGKVVLIEFFTISCPHCRASLPHTTAIYNEFKKTGKFYALGITALFGTYYDGEKRVSNVKKDEEIKLMNEYFKNHSINFPIYYTNNEKVFKNYQIEGVPTFIIISKEWKIVKVVEGGGEQNLKIVKDTIKKLLK